MKIVVECGQRVWRYRSWVPFKYPKTGRNWKRTFRRFPDGFAIGPLMFIKK